MTLLTSLARICFGVAIIAFGLLHFVYGKFVTRLVPSLPVGTLPHRFWPYVVGVVLVVLGVMILLEKRARIAGLVLGSLLLLSFLFLYLPPLLHSAPLSGLWTNAGKVLAMAAGAFLIAGSFSRRGSRPLSHVFLSVFLIVAGIQHFLFASFVAGLVPRWIPNHLFWTYFAGVALIAGGLGMLIPKFQRLAALLSGTMIWLWLVMLHIPRALAAPHDSNETAAVFEALAIGATAFLVAGRRDSARFRF